MDAAAEVDVGEVVALAIAAMRGAGVEVTGIGDEALMGRVKELESLRRAVDAVSAAVVGELDVRGVTDRLTGFPTRTWLAVDGHLPRDVANRRVKVAALLRHCEVLAAALRDGRITVDHVRVVAEATNDRNRGAVVSLQDHLVGMVSEFPRFEAWATQVRALLDLADQDGGHDPRPEDNRLHLSHGLNGDLQLEASFVGEQALTVQSTLNRIADQLFDRAVRDRDRAPGDCTLPARSALLALAFAECCRLAAGATGTGSSPAADITLVIHANEPESVRTTDGHRVDPATARLACCDGVHHPLVVDAEGVPLHLGRGARFANRDQRRAVHQRDGGCVFPGCDVPAGWTDVHHVIQWDHGGTTDVQNLACLCRHHHGVVHRTGWSMATVEHQWFRIVTPSGRVLPSQRHGRPGTG